MTTVYQSTAARTAPPPASGRGDAALDQAVFIAFVLAVFLGVKRVGPVSLPVWLVMLPVMLWRFPPRQPLLRSLHPALLLALVPALLVPLQVLAGFPPIREDVGVYLPVVCTLIVLASFSGLTLSDRALYRGLMVGGVYICVSIAVALYWKCDDIQTPLTFYLLKQLVSTPLGDSNYLAVFLVLLFSVALYQRSLLAIVFALFTLLTMSRSGLLALFAVVAIWAIAEFRLLRAAVATAAVGSALIAATALTGNLPRLMERTNVAGLVVFTPLLTAMNDACVVPQVLPIPAAPPPPGSPEDLPGRSTSSRTDDMTPSFSRLPPPEEPTSMDDRFSIWRGAFHAMSNHPIIGVPRSYFRHVFPTGRWGAHSWPLELLTLFGLIGFVAYTAYLASGTSFIVAMVRQSPVWKGVLLGVAVTALWGLIEVVLLAPSYDTLLATLFMVAFNRVPPAARGFWGLAPIEWPRPSRS